MISINGEAVVVGPDDRLVVRLSPTEVDGLDHVEGLVHALNDLLGPSRFLIAVYEGDLAALRAGEGLEWGCVDITPGARIARTRMGVRTEGDGTDPT